MIANNTSSNPTKKTMAVRDESHASIDLSDAWTTSCRRVMGLPAASPAPPKKSSQVHITNLLPMDEIDGETLDTSMNDSMETSDSAMIESDLNWVQAANEIKTSMENMTGWIHEKKCAFVSLEMTEEEASLIQSTVTSFAATTANEIESLRQLIPSDSSQINQHQTGIVQILLATLKEQIAVPFGSLVKQRQRAAVQLWQNPLEIQVTPGKVPPFRPTRPFLYRRDFMAAYEEDEDIVPVPPPEFTLGGSKKRPLESPKQQQEKRKAPIFAKPKDPIAAIYADNDDNDDLFQQELRQEAVLLQASLHNDLDNVQAVEQRMTDITTLLTQFAELVTEQQENVLEIREATVTAKENVEQGQDQLMEAKERTSQSSHRMAKAVMTMSFVLLLFHWIKA